MSIAAINWALAQRTDGPSAQIVLFVVADAANERGICRHADPDYIADRSRQSRATVFRRLGELEVAGALSRFKTIGPRGEPIYEIRLHLDRSVDYERTSACAEDRSEPAPEDRGEVVESQFETLTGETGGVSPVRLGESHSCDSKSPSKSPYLPPKPPPCPGGPPQGLRSDGVEDAARLAHFKATMPSATSRPDRLAALVAALTPDEWEALDLGARAYAAARPRNPIDPERFVRRRIFREWAAKAPPAPPAIWVAQGSLEALAHEVFARACGRSWPGATWSAERREAGWLVRASWPPFGAGLPSDERDWWFVERGTREFWAWCERIRVAGAASPRLRSEVAADRYRGAAGRAVLDPLTTTALGDGRRIGLLAPCRWPPRRDGTIATGPPDLASDDDLDEFERTG